MCFRSEILLQDPRIGLIPRVLHDLFRRLDERSAVQESSVSVSHVELYNENLFDLLTADEFADDLNKRTKLRLYEVEVSD